MKKLLIFILLAGTLASAAYGFTQGRAARDMAFKADSLVAAADTARVIEVGDSVTAYQLRIVQTELERDSLDRRLRLRPVVRIQGELRIDTLHFVDTVPGPPISEGELQGAPARDTTQVYEFGGEDGPFTFLGSATLFPNRTQVFHVNVTSAPVGVSAAIGCGNEKPIRSASLLLTADDPYVITPTGVTQTREVCNSQRKPLLSISVGKSAWAAGGFILGYIAANLLDDGFRVANY